MSDATVSDWKKILDSSGLKYTESLHILNNQISLKIDVKANRKQKASIGLDFSDEFPFVQEGYEISLCKRGLFSNKIEKHLMIQEWDEILTSSGWTPKLEYIGDGNKCLKIMYVELTKNTRWCFAFKTYIRRFSLVYDTFVLYDGK